MSSYPGLLADLLRGRQQPQIPMQPLQTDVPSLEEIAAKIGINQPAAPAPAPTPAPAAAPPVEDPNQSKFNKLLEESLGVDWQQKAMDILAKQGLKPPTAPGEFKVSPMAALAALGPALGALLGGQPSMAAQAGAGVLGKYRSSWEEEQERFGVKQKEYSQIATTLGEKMAARADKTLATLAPYLTMTAAERAKNAVDWRQIEIAAQNADANSQRAMLEGLRVGLDREKQQFDRTYQSNQQAIELLKISNAEAGKRAELALAQKKQQFDQWHSKQTLLIQGGQLQEAVRHNKAAEAISLSHPADQMGQLKVAMVKDKLQQGDMDGAIRLAFGAQLDRMPEQHRLFIQEYTSLLGRKNVPPEQLEAARQRANVGLKAQGMPEAPPTPPGSDPIKAVIDFFSGILKGRGTP